MFVCFAQRSTTSLIWTLAEGGRWDEMEDILALQPQALPLRAKYLPEALAKLPILSYAIWHGAPETIVMRILDIDPESLVVEDSKRRLSLHIACLRSASPSIIDFLVGKDPRPVMRRDENGNIPLHYAVAQACSNTPRNLDEHLDSLSSLIVANPNSILVPNQAEEAPISIAKRCDKRKPKPVYIMLSNNSKAFNVNSRVFLNEDDFTAPSSSIFLEDPSSMNLGDDTLADAAEWEEQQAIGERPRRRNAVPNILKPARLYDFVAHAH